MFEECLFDNKTKIYMSPSLNTQLAGASEESELIAQSQRAANAQANKKPIVDLPHLITQSQQAWYKRIGNVGGGNNPGENPDQPGNSVNIVGTLFSGGILGSYGISRNGTLNQEIDRIAAAQTKTAYNSTLKLTDIFTRSSDKIDFLSKKTSACETLEYDLDQLMEKNRQSIALFENMRKAINPGLIGRMREGIANAWEGAKDTMSANSGKTVAGAALATGAVAAIGPASVASGIGAGAVAVASTAGTAVAYGGAGLVALGSAAISSPFIAVPVATAAVMAAGMGIHKMISDRKSLQTSMKMLEDMRANVVAIRVKTETERDALVAKISQRYGAEVQVEKNMRELLNLRCSEKHPEIIEELETALQDQNPTPKLNALMKKITTDGTIFHDALEIAHLERYFATLGNRRSVNFRANVSKLIDGEEAKGPDGVIRLTKHLKRLNSLTGIRGKKVTFTGKPYALSDLSTDEKGADVLILRDATKPDEKIALTVAGDKVEVRQPIVPFTKIRDSLKALYNSTAEKTVDIQQLIQKGMGRFLESKEYKKLAAFLATLKPKPSPTDGLDAVAKTDNPISVRFVTPADTLKMAV